jgi:hypothetical protein
MAQIESPYWTLAEAAIYARRHVNTIRNAIRAGELHAVGKTHKLTTRRWVDDWLERDCDDEPEEQAG